MSVKDCNKISYSSKAEARKAAKEILFLNRKYSHQHKQKRPNKKMYEYPCKHCCNWHLSSSKPFSSKVRKSHARMDNV